MTISTPHIVVLDQNARCPGFITDLILRCAQGDEPALGALFDLFAPMVIAEITEGTHTPETDELVVEAFHRVWARASDYNPASRSAVRWILEQVRDVPGEFLSAS